MLASNFLSLLVGAGLASAAVVPRAPRSPRVLSEHEILLFSNDGRIEVRRRTEYPLLDLSHVTAPISSTWAPSSSHNLATRSSSSSSNLDKRGDTTIFIRNAPQDFLGWDVPMSSVVRATGNTSTIAVTPGYQIANSIMIGGSITGGVSGPNNPVTGGLAALLTGMLQVTVTTSYTKTWTSTYTSAYTFIMPPGKYGAIVSNPKTHRESGAIFQGRIGSNGTYTTYMADSYTSKAYDSLSWVDGVISLCTGDTYPLPRCLGSGTL